MEGRSTPVQVQVQEEKKRDTNNKENKKRNHHHHHHHGYRIKLMPRFGCLRTETDEKGSFDISVDVAGASPTHLVIMVNGIIGSAQNWRYAAKQFLKRYPKEVIVHCSERNSSMLTFDGVDVMGDRLAEEVIDCKKRHPSVQKISFVGHSLGGLVARYAIARLYGQDVPREVSHGNGDSKGNDSGEALVEKQSEGKIAGLEPINFITLASPHLGSGGHKQVPLFCGFHTLEKAATSMSWCLGRTGKHLFLTDRDKGKPPLLLQMASDCEDLKFISALQSFKRRVAYANVRFDHLVGWSTSSLRRRNELPKRQHLKSDEKYPHIVNVETAKSTSPLQDVPLEATSNGCKHIDIEEEIIGGLTKLSWERVDVNFKRSKQRYLAHSTIQVKHYRVNSEGAYVLQHMIDNFIS